MAIAQRRRSRNLVSRVVCVVTLGVLVLVASPAGAHITRIQITAKESPTFGGYSWPGVGQYEKIVGKAFGEVDPADPKNAVIVDIALAPRNARGNVEYSFDFYILKPIDLTQGRAQGDVRAAEPRRQDLERVEPRASGGNDPGSITDPAVLANSFLMPRGYTMVWSGWDTSAGTSTANFNATITLPVAKNSGRLVDHRPGVRIHRERSGASYHAELSGGHARQDQGHADPSRAPERHAAR